MMGMQMWRARRGGRAMRFTAWTWRRMATQRVVEMETQVREAAQSARDRLGLQWLGRIKDVHANANNGAAHCQIEIATPALQGAADQAWRYVLEIASVGRIVLATMLTLLVLVAVHGLSLWRMQWKHQAEQRIGQIDWVKHVDVTVAAARPRNPRVARSSPLATVSEILAISSCKGGVGKSTVAVNLAFALAKTGARVGILDADIYGPSLPTMVSPSDHAVRKAPNKPHMVLPLDAAGVKCMSFGFVNPKAAPGAGGVGAALLRGPMVSKLIGQLALGTEWGELDYLVVDMPPGTGDVQIALSQHLPISAAVVVTTPQQLSLIDVEKGIAMFQDLKVETAVIVENMAFFDCIHGHRHYPFGTGHTQRLVDKYQFKHVFQLPISSECSSAGDNGRPFVLDNATALASLTFSAMAQCVAEQVAILRSKTKLTPTLVFDRQRGMVIRVFGPVDAKEIVVHPADLRARCRCAQCVDEFTGKQVVSASSIPDDIHPIRIEPKGNYAFAVAWSDGHMASLYTHDALEHMAAEFAAPSQ